MQKMTLKSPQILESRLEFNRSRTFIINQNIQNRSNSVLRNDDIILK